jgi:hypothetical protein
MLPKFYSDRHYHAIASATQEKIVMRLAGFEPTIPLLSALKRTVIWIVLPGNKHNTYLMKMSGRTKD